MTQENTNPYKKPSPFTFIKNLSDKSNGHMLSDDHEGELNEKAYSPFIVNRGMSMHKDLALWANQMNMLNHLEDRLQYDFFYYGIRQQKRNAPWVKRAKEEYLPAVQRFFQYSPQKSKELIKSGILSDEDLDKIQKWYETCEGGKS